MDIWFPLQDKVFLTIYSVPTCDNSGELGEIFLPDSPHALLRAGKFSDVPLITGIVSHEGMLGLKGKFIFFFFFHSQFWVSNSHSATA